MFPFSDVILPLGGRDSDGGIEAWQDWTTIPIVAGDNGEDDSSDGEVWFLPSSSVSSCAFIALRGQTSTTPLEVLSLADGEVYEFTFVWGACIIRSVWS